jgi:hypothetical protein
MTREQVLARRERPTETVPCPELGDGATLTVRRLSAKEFMALTERAKAQPDLAYAHWIVATVIDDQGNAMFSEADAAELAEQDITLVERLTDAAQRLNLAGKGQAAKN